jgi:peptidyl-prolyl cis-trans isomerase D
MLKKKWSRYHFYSSSNSRVWDQEVSVALLTSEFDKLGLRVGEKHILEILKADQNIGKNPMFLNTAGVLILLNSKNFKSNPAQAQFF